LWPLSKLAVADGALGFWQAIEEVWPQSRGQHCWVHKTAETWGVKYDKAVECLVKDRDALLAFYDFSAEHWKHCRSHHKEG
jgi:putative transposase